ncbi:hypothetical protein BaRGS_00010833 [Batillaria attramentaria]|uniref:Uncharacterized protein n=1 Tax=Batillaria attramentaria TaxID=370345 RepID=A0ABD0LF69_9CAEN
MILQPPQLKTWRGKKEKIQCSKSFNLQVMIVLAFCHRGLWWAGHNNPALTNTRLQPLLVLLHFNVVTSDWPLARKRKSCTRLNQRHSQLEDDLIIPLKLMAELNADVSFSHLTPQQRRTSDKGSERQLKRVLCSEYPAKSRGQERSTFQFVLSVHSESLEWKSGRIKDETVQETSFDSSSTVVPLL